MKIIINNANGLFIRKEEKNIVAYITKTGREICLNETGYEIYQLSKVCTDTKQILKKLQKRYTMVDSRILEKDMMEILYVLQVYDIIKIESTISESENCPMAVKAVGDADYNQVSDFILNIGLKNDVKYLQESNSEYYKAVGMRYRTFNNEEYYFYAKQNNKIFATISVIPPNSIDVLSINISSVFFDDNNTIDFSREIFLKLLERIVIVLNLENPKFRITSIHDIPNELLNIMQTIGFEKECILENETIHGDLIMYTKKY